MTMKSDESTPPSTNPAYLDTYHAIQEATKQAQIAFQQAINTAEGKELPLTEWLPTGHASYVERMVPPGIGRVGTFVWRNTPKVLLHYWPDENTPAKVEVLP